MGVINDVKAKCPICEELLHNIRVDQEFVNHRRSLRAGWPEDVLRHIGTVTRIDGICRVCEASIKIEVKRGV